MKKVIPNIKVTNCKEALDFYKEVFGGQIKNVQLADGKEMFKGHEGKIIHAEMHVNSDCIFYFNDNFEPENNTSNISLILVLDNEEEINKLFTSLSEKGTVQFPLQKTFWGSYHAVVTDCYGVVWNLDFAK